MAQDGDEPPPLYKPELVEVKKKYTLLQHCYMEPWIPAGTLLARVGPCSQPTGGG